MINLQNWERERERKKKVNQSESTNWMDNQHSDLHGSI